MTRVHPLPDDEWDDRTRDAFSMLLPRHRRNVRGAGNILATLARHPDLARAFVTFSTHLTFTSTLPARLRELVILRVARLSDCEYEWHHHALAAAELGFTPAEIEDAGRGVSNTAAGRAVLTAVDELRTKTTVSDRTWSALGEHLDERQRMDLVFTIGGYGLLSAAINTFGVRPEDHIERDERLIFGNG